MFFAKAIFVEFEFNQICVRFAQYAFDALELIFKLVRLELSLILALLHL